MKNLIKVLCVFAFLSFSFQGQSQKLKSVSKTQLKVLKTEKIVEITAPKNNQSVTSPLTAKGKTIPGTDINLQIVAKFTGGEQDLGTFTIKSDDHGNWTSIPINLWLPEDAKNAEFDIIAMKSSNGTQKEQDKITVKPPSNILLVARKDFENVKMKDVKLKKANLNTSLLETLKSAPPRITSPSSNAQVSSPIIVKGTGLKNTPIEIHIQSNYAAGKQDLGVFRTTSDASGNWQTIPINLWAPDDAKNVSYVITATQFDEDNRPSREGSVTAVPKQGQIMLVNSHPSLVQAKLQPKLTQVSKRPTINVPVKEEPVKEEPNLGPVDKPIIINPTNGSISRDGRFQIMGTGTPGHTVKSTVNLVYYLKRNKQHKNFSFDAQVASNGVWRTELKNYSVPKEAYDIQYSITSHQIRSEDNKRSATDKASLSQMISSPKLSHFSYKAPDFASSGSGQVWNGITGKKYYEHVYLKGDGGAGLKVSISVDTIKDGKKRGGRRGTVDVDSAGHWKWDAGWRVKDGSDTVDSFVVKITQSNPGDESDKSETVVESRTK